PARLYGPHGWHYKYASLFAARRCWMRPGVYPAAAHHARRGHDDEDDSSVLLAVVRRVNTTFVVMFHHAGHQVGHTHTFDQGVVVEEGQLRHDTQAHRFAEQRADETRGFLQ